MRTKADADSRFPARALAAALLAGAVLSVHGDASADEGRGFMDVTRAVGLLYRPEHDAPGEPGFRRPEPEDGGLAFGDIDNDGSPELYVAHGDEETGRLFGYDGRRFVRLEGDRGIAPGGHDRAGYFIDLDGDGWQDFLSIRTGRVEFFRNDRTGHFVEAGDAFDIRFDRNTHSMAAADYDGDGDLDLFFAHWDNPWNRSRPLSQYLWRNDGAGRYTDVSPIVPVRPFLGPERPVPWEFSFTPTFADMDADGDPDILLTGDFGTSQILRNDAGKAFTDIAGYALTDENGMGAAVADFDRDGDLDWFVTSIHDPDGSAGQGTTGNRLYRNADGGGLLEDATEAAGVREGGWGWGACAADFDNDGHPDLFHTNGWFDKFLPQARDLAPGEEGEFGADRSRLFLSNGDGTFSERGAALGISHMGQGRGAVCADYDGDGRVDIFIANHGGHPTVYANRMETGNHWLAIDLAGRHANPQAIGARVTVSTATGRQLQEVQLGGSYLSQGPPTLHFGLGSNDVAQSIEVRWPGPGGQVSRLENMAADRRVTIRQPEPVGVLLNVVGGSGSGLYAAGETVAIGAGSAPRHHRFSHWSREGGGAFEDARSPETAFAMPEGPATVLAHFLPGPPLADPDISVARRWMEVLLQAIRDDFARPTVHARNLFHLSAAMYDAWAVHAGTARPYLFGDATAPCSQLSRPPGGGIRRAREAAIGHAAWLLIRHRFRHSPGAVRTARSADSLMSALGLDPEDGGGAAAVGRCIGEFYIARGLADGSNEANDYAAVAYRPANLEMEPMRPGNPDIENLDRWQPLDLRYYVDQSGNLTGSIPEFITPEWGRVAPFALSAADLTVYRRDGADWHVYHDPGPPPLSQGSLAAHYKWGFSLVARWSSHLSPDDGVAMDIAPSGIGNIRAYPEAFEDYPSFYDGNPHGPGHRVNPATGKPYEPQIVPRGDYARVLAEFWADGPDSETPPGHWFTILNAVNDHPALVRRLGGEGPALDPLAWDVKTYFALGGAMHDAAIAAWGIKGWHDYIRPVSAIRAMADRGQSSDPGLPSWSPDGLPLAPGLIELVGPDDPLAGEDGAHAGKIKLRAWRGPTHVGDPETGAAGVGWILAENWWPYQRPTFVTPPFAGYVSGHSTYSRAAAEVLTALTGDPFFPGGMSGFQVPANRFLVFERGPSVDMVLQWATYRDAADQCSLSRIWGGIHPPADDIPGRNIGEKVGTKAVLHAMSYFQDSG